MAIGWGDVAAHRAPRGGCPKFSESRYTTSSVWPLQLQLANCLSELQWPDEAKALYKAVLQQKPRHPDALNNQALLARRLGKARRPRAY
ncbi:MAG: hypothetical protein Ct9H300mP13_5650 [Gammaproteobacteria bacterium]|nr:MAG: hypothetical protein Ct9H300mP13_5650 [Gammaproteobacteria bacterium]